MINIRLEISPYFADVLHVKGSEWINIEKDLKQWASIGDILVDLANNNVDFRKLVFNPLSRELTDEVMIALNGSLLQLSNLLEVKLKDGDHVMILPMVKEG